MQLVNILFLTVKWICWALSDYNDLQQITINYKTNYKTITTNYNQLQDQLQDNYNQLQPITTNYNPITINYNPSTINYTMIYNQLQDDYC